MKRLWLLFSAIIILSFSVLGWIGTRIYQEAPPIPDKVVTTSGAAVTYSGEIQAGQNVWQSLVGMQVGSIWGHGSYVAPDWSADWLHREAVFILDRWSNDEIQSDYESLSVERQAQLSGRLTTRLRANTYDQSSETMTIDPLRAEAFAANLAHCTAQYFT